MNLTIKLKKKLTVRLRKLGIGCKLFDVYYGCLLYADDILLLSHSVNAMRRMLAICNQFAVKFDLKFNLIPASH